jgi:TolB protein
MRINALLLTGGLLAGFSLGPARAQLTVEITGAGTNRLPVAIADFAGERIISQAITSVIRLDLDRSGVFRLIDTGTVLA